MKICIKAGQQLIIGTNIKPAGTVLEVTRVYGQELINKGIAIAVNADAEEKLGKPKIEKQVIGKTKKIENKIFKY